MGAKKKRVKAQGNDATNGMVVSSSFARWNFGRLRALRRLDRRILIATGCVVLVLVVSSVILLRGTASAPKAPLPADIDSSYAGTNIKNFPVLLDHDYGLTVNDVVSGNLGHELKTFDEAQNVAIVLARLGHKDRALEAFKVAATKKGADNNSDFYINFMGLAYQQGDSALGQQMYEKAVSIVKASNLPAADKQAALDDLRYKNGIAKSGGNR